MWHITQEQETLPSVIRDKRRKLLRYLEFFNTQTLLFGIALAL
jgi:hypothetical protein